MEIEEAKKLKKRMDHDIKTIVNTFERQTNLIVRELYLDEGFGRFGSREFRIITKVIVE